MGVVQYVAVGHVFLNVNSRDLSVWIYGKYMYGKSCMCMCHILTCVKTQVVNSVLSGVNLSLLIPLSPSWHDRPAKYNLSPCGGEGRGWGSSIRDQSTLAKK